MPNITGTLTAGQDLWQESSTQLHSLGALGFDKFGNRYRYTKMGAVAGVAAHLYQEPAEDTQFNTMAVPAAVAIGETAITVTNGTTAVTADMFKDGHLIIDTTPGLGQHFYIIKHTTGASGASITYTVDRPLKVALTTSSKVTVRKNPYNGILITPATTSTGGPDGVALFATTIAYYSWIGSGGDQAVTFDTGTNTANDLQGIEPSLAVAGQVKVSAGTSGDSFIGYTRQVVSVDSTSSLAKLILD